MLLQHINNFSDIIHGTIQVSCIEKMIISTPEFNRLHKIMQNSTLYLTFPCNSVKRFEHSIGTMHIAGNIFYHCISNSRDDVLDDFFNEAQLRIDDILSKEFLRNNLKILGHEYIRESGLLSNRGEIKLPHEAFLNTYIPYNLVENAKALSQAARLAQIKAAKKQSDEKAQEAMQIALKKERKASGRIFDYLVIFEAIRILGLLHDVGHLPYSHALEKALQNIFYNLNEKLRKKPSEINPKEKEYINFFNREFLNEDKPVEIHEKIGRKITESIFESLRDEWVKTVNNQDRPIYAIGLLAFEMVMIILGDGDRSNEKQSLFYTSLHEIVDGTFDADRLDYICRDTTASIYNKHILDYNCFINSMIFIKHESNFRIAVPLKYISDVESFLSKRWEIHAKINYHNRAAKMYMLLIHCVTELGLKELSSKVENKQFKSDDEPDYIIHNNISGIWETLYTLPEETSYKYFAYRLMQLDDGWLDSIIRKAYFIEKNKEDGDKDLKLEEKLEELISNRKVFYSLLKMDYDFKTIDEKFREYFFTDEQFNNCLKLAEELESKQVSRGYVPKDNEVIISNDLPRRTLKKLTDLKKLNEARGNFNGLFFRMILKTIKELGLEKTDLELYEPLKEAILNTDNNIRDSFVVPIPAKTGIKNVWFYKGMGNNDKVDLHELSKVSNIDKKLNLNCDCLPGFYVFYSLKELQKEVKIEDLFNNIAKATATILLNNIFEGLTVNKETFFSGN